MFNLKKDKLTPNQILLKNRVLAATIPLRNLEDFGRVKRYASDPWKDEIQRKITHVLYTFMFSLFAMFFVVDILKKLLDDKIFSNVLLTFEFENTYGVLTLQ